MLHYLGPSVLVVFHRPDDTELFIVPRNQDTNDLIENLMSIDNTVQGANNLTADQRDIYDNIENDLSEYTVGKRSVRGVNIDADYEF